MDVAHDREYMIYFVEKSVKWTDFLASSGMKDLELREMMRCGKLCAYFIADEAEAGYLFKCNRVYENKLRCFFEDMANAGYEVREG
ncbi:MAG: hypothetical protein NC417_08430 [Candidatus Gastranaerophilales bacterium]|nr:hypothetical protein [Candidatus Gastranaerophilales bacterium]